MSLCLALVEAGLTLQNVERESTHMSESEPNMREPAKSPPM